VKRRSGRLLVLCVVWVLSAGYVGGFLDRGWIPHDEGCLAHSAERVLRGELPHRDFDEIYTGALSWLHALGFELAGVNLLSMRYVLLALFLAWVPALYGIALRFAPPLAAGAVTLAAVAWSLPNYFASMPSWYNLFFASFAAFCLLRHVETGRPRWLFAAGLWGGLSFLVKVVGLYSIAAGLLFLLFREQVLSSAAALRRGRALSVLLLWKAIGCAAFAGLLVFLLRRRLHAMEILHFIVPGVALCAFLLWSEVHFGAGRLRERLSRLWRLLLPYGAGAAIPILLFLLPYIFSGALDDLFRGLFLLPQKRLESASTPLPPLTRFLPALPYALVLALPALSAGTRLTRLAAGGAVVLLGFGLYASTDPVIYRVIWDSARSLAVVCVLAGCVVLARSVGAVVAAAEPPQKLFVLLSSTALVSLVQFPFAGPIYFCYVAPLVALTILAIVSTQSAAPRLLHLTLLAFYLLFAVLRMNPGYVWTHGFHYQLYAADGVLDVERGGIRVPKSDEREYKEVLALIRAHGSGAYIYAAPDCPEVYFLAERRNPTRDILEFLGDSPGKRGYIVRMLEERGVRAVVVNRAPHFSPPIEPGVERLLADRFPRSAQVGRFLVRWKD